MRTVSFVVPVKGSEATIGRTVGALLEQDYEGQIEVIVVGDVGDSSWAALGRELGSGSVRAIEVSVQSAGRDSNAKRNVGLEAAGGEILCLVDSDIVLPKDWLSTAVSLIEAGHTCVSGPMRSVTGGFWARYTDQNPYASKTPRMDDQYISRPETFGVLRKPATTSNVAFTRELFEWVGGFDSSFVHSYEDYEWFYRVARAQFPVLCTSRLAAEHHHRQGFRALGDEYRRSGRGCAQFVRKHPSSGFARKRLLQLLAVVTVAMVVLLYTIVGFTIRGAPIHLLALAAPALVLATATAWRTQSVSGVAFPFVTLVLGTAFTMGLLRGLIIVQPPERPMVPPETLLEVT